jgi:hypothetical protein
MAISAQDVQASYAAAGLPPPSAQDIQYWTQTYAQSPDVVFSPNPQQQVVNAILASAPDEYDQGQFNFLAGGANLAGTTGFNIPQSDADIERQVKEDVAKFIEARDAEQSTAGIGALLNTSQFTPQITPGIAADLIGRSQTGGVLTSEFDQYGGYDAVKNVYDASGGAGAGAGAGAVETINLSTRTTPPNVDTTNLFTSTGDTRAVTGPPVPDYGYINDLYKTYFGRDASAQELASYAGIFGPTIEPNEIKDFILGGVTSEEITQDEADILLGLKPDPAKIAAETEAANAEGRPGAGQILGIPTFARQTPSDLTFAPLRRGLGQLRPAMSMPGLTSGQAAFGGVAPTPVQPSGNVVSPLPATPYALPEDFALQTGAYGAPTPTFLARNSTAAGPAGVDQPTYAQLLDNVQRLGAQVETLSGTNQDFYDSRGGDDPTDPGPGPGPNDDGMGFGGMDSPGPSETGGDGVDYEMGGLIRMAEGGEPPTPPPMSKLSDEDLGSTFDINDYIEKGILVGGMSKPIRDEYGMIIGYKSDENDKLPLPIQRDVVFGRELRDKETAMRLTDAEREQMMVEMAMRQGRTGISPTTGGLAGIQIGDPMVRRRPQYYSTVEDFRPRYAEGGIASVAQNLADKGRKGDSMLVHMTPDEVAGLQALAQQMGGSLTINPQTGLPEANIFKKLLPMALGFALGPAGAGLFQSALTAGLAVGAGYTLATGSLQQGISAGLGAYGGSNLGTGLQAAGTAGADVAVGNAAANEAAKTAATGVGEFAGGVNAAQVTGPTVSGGLTPFADITKMPVTSTPSTVAIPQGASYTGTVDLGSALTPTTPADAMISATPTAPVQPSAFDRTLTGARKILLVIKQLVI